MHLVDRPTAMAPRLARSQRLQLQDMIELTSLSNIDVARMANCSTRTVTRARANVRHFGTTDAPKKMSCHRSCIPPHVRDALLERLFTKPDLYLDEMADFILDDFELSVSADSIRRMLKACNWSKKKNQRVARQRDADLRDACLHELSEYKSHQLVFVDESGCDTQLGMRRTGWAPRGLAPVQTARFQREQRYQILPAYSQDGVIHVRIFQGATDGDVFEAFVEELLSFCGRWPEPKSVLVMDNASFHYSPAIQHLCDQAGVKLMFLSPYSPDLNPIEELFSQLKSFVRRHWRKQASNFNDFGEFLGWTIGIVGSDIKSAHGHFRNSGLSIDIL